MSERMWSEDEIRTALNNHHPEARWCNDETADLDCSCEVEWAVEHFIAALKGEA